MIYYICIEKLLFSLNSIVIIPIQGGRKLQFLLQLCLGFFYFNALCKNLIFPILFPFPSLSPSLLLSVKLLLLSVTGCQSFTMRWEVVLHSYCCPAHKASDLGRSHALGVLALQHLFAQRQWRESLFWFSRPFPEAWQKKACFELFGPPCIPRQEVQHQGDQANKIIRTVAGAVRSD